ncbi:MAG: NADH:ubiquinone reductase (Na(+)-transporting) subunit B [Bacteroidetes bacterium]|nr:NADH:ubiquinone reductase (Na(+)-transporting) subunit B [Bacteroidota bacterium]
MNLRHAISKPIRNVFDKIKPHVQPGEKFEMAYTTFDAIESLLFVPDHTTKSGVHIRDGIDLKRTMITVVIAMIPALLFGIWNAGHQHYLAIGEFAGVREGFLLKLLFGSIKVLPIVAVSYGVGLTIEFISVTIKKEQVNEGFLVTGMLIPLVMPVNIPLWMVAVATVFAVVIGKEAFGGTGMNILNVALTARAFLFFAYPKNMSGDDPWVASSVKDGQALVDGFTGETPLAQAVENGTNITSVSGEAIGLSDFVLGTIPGSIGETSSVAILLGASILLITGIGSWRIMLSVVLGGLTMGYIFNLLGLNAFMSVPFYYHLFMGGFMFGMVFMATDPVTAAQTNRGKYIYGFLIGLLAVMIRVFNPAYPEGMMLAILLMNVFAPLIDHYVIQGNINRRLAHG